MNNQCGTCVFAQAMPTDLKVVECFGMPPYPVAMPTPQGIQLGAVTPRVERSRPACSLYSPRLAVSTKAGLSAVGS